MKVIIIVMPKEKILHPESAFILKTLGRLGLPDFSRLSLGKYYEFELPDNAETEAIVQSKMEKLARDRLANHNTEDFRIVIDR